MRIPSWPTFVLALSVLACGSSSSPATDAASAAGAIVNGTVTLPAVAADKPWTVKLFASVGDPSAPPIAEASGTTTDAPNLMYTLTGVPAGTYFLLGFVDVEELGGNSSMPGDYAGWYGHDGSGNPPPAPNVTVPASGTVTFDFALVVR